MKITCRNGLCDRLFTIFGFLSKTRPKKEPLEVFWPIDQECNGHFLDVFKPLYGVVFSEHHFASDFDGFLPGPELVSEDVLRLAPTDALQRRINKLSESMGRYSAVHVRRTDKLDPIKAPFFVKTEDEVFFEFIDGQIHDRIFLAADSKDTQDCFARRYGERIFFVPISPSENLRQTDLAQAVLDLFVCVGSNSFFGTKKSGFTGMIETIRGFRRERRTIKLI